MRRVPVKKVAKIVNGKTPKGVDDKFQEGGAIPFFRVSDMNFEGNNLEMQVAKNAVSTEDASKLKLKIAKPGTVIFPKRGGAISTNKKRILVKPSAYDLNTMGLTPNEKVNNKYFYYWFNNIDLGALADGSSVPQLNNKQIEPLEIPLPSLSEQKAIVAKLDRSQRLIDIDREMLAKYDDLIQNVFLEMFGDPVRNEKGWEVKKLGDILENKDSDRVPVKKSDRKEMAGEYPYYGASGIVDYVDDYLFEGPNLLIGEDGANLLSRSTDIAFIADGKYWVNNHAHVLGSDKIEKLHYVKYFINNLDLEPYITGSAQPKLNQSNLNEIEVPMPDAEHIDVFKNISDSIQYEIEKTNISSKKSGELFSSLVQEVFS